MRVALINDYEIVVQGLASMLRSYQDRVQVVELNTNQSPGQRVDIAMFDTFAGAHADRSQVQLLAADPLVDKIVVYSWNLDQALVDTALDNGASGYLSKQLPARQLVAALTAVHHGDQQVCPGPPHPRAATAGDWPGREEGLTQREAEVLALITQGLDNAQIADRAHLSINSVKSYIRSCYRRIGVTNRSNAILWGVEHGFRPDQTRTHPPDIQQ